jgi:acetyl esterase/lipase
MGRNSMIGKMGQTRRALLALLKRRKPQQRRHLWTFEDVPYYLGPNACEKKHALDVYMPSSPFPRPLSRAVLFVHGGAWRRGDRRHALLSGPLGLYGRVGRAIAVEGMVGCVMSYRLQDITFEDQAMDVARALAWMHRSIENYGGKSTDLAVVGHSAGAHLAALTLTDPRWLTEAGSKFAGNDSTLTRSVRAFVGLSGIYDIPALAARPFVGRSMVEPVFGCEKERWRAASPIHVMNKDSPLARMHVMLLSAEKDFHLEGDADKLMDSLHTAGEGHDVIRERLRVRGDHASTVLGFGATLHSEGFESAQAILKFLKRAKP